MRRRIQRTETETGTEPEVQAEPAPAPEVAEEDLSLVAHGASVLVQVKDWREKTAALRTALEKKRAVLRDQLRVIEEAIAELPPIPGTEGRRPSPQHYVMATKAAQFTVEAGKVAATVMRTTIPAVSAQPPTFHIPDKSTTDMIVECLRHAGPEGSTAAEIATWLKTKAFREVNPRHIHTYLYRLSNGEPPRIVGVGDKGSRRYRLPRQSEQKEDAAMSE